ncbi:MAG TPA: M1 family aminopeptidase [Flavobacteriales bacterium]
MSVSLRAVHIPSALLVATTLLAQPERRGCHFFRNGVPEMPSLTDAQRSDIAATIARSDTFDIEHYDIAIDITDVAGQRIKAATTIRFRAMMEDQSLIRFDLTGLQVDSVVRDGEALPFNHDGDILAVDLLTPGVVHELQQLTVHYQGQPIRDPEWGGFYFEGGYIYNLGIGLSTIPPNFGKVWYPCFDSFVERATYTYHVKSAGGYRAHGQGDLLSEVQLGGDTVILSFGLDLPIPTHISAIAAGNYEDHDAVHTGAYGDIPVRLTAKPTQLAAMVSKFVNLGNAIDACEFWYGPYQWGRVGYVLTTDGALEIPSNIAYPDFMTTQSDADNRALFAHELGHHWWGDMVTPYTHNDMWVKEGPAEYSGHLLEEWIDGPQGLVEAVKSNQLYVLRQAHLQDGGFQALSPMPDEHIYGLHTYYKGASVMHNLRGYLGDTLFRQAMQGVQVEAAFSALSAEGFRDALELVSGADLHPFFQDQVFTPGFSVFLVHQFSAQPDAGAWSVDLDIRQRLRGTTSFHHDVPLDVTFIGAEGQTQEHLVMAGGEFTDLQLAADFEPVMVVLNRHTRLNQARMDHERVLVPGESFPTVQPRTDFSLYQDELVDSTLIRIEHIWAGPDQDLVDPGITQISSTHFWVVDGLWPEGTALHARLTYNGGAETSMDHDLFAETEEFAVLVYRENGEDPWTIYPDQTLSANSLTNGIGYLYIDVLRKGQYAFAKGQSIAGVEEERAERPLQVFPVPAQDRISVRIRGGYNGSVAYTIFGADGRTVLQGRATTSGGDPLRIGTGALSNGSYLLRLNDDGGVLVGTTTFQVQH